MTNNFENQKNDRREDREKESPEFNTEVLSKLNDRVLQDVLLIEESCVPESWRFPDEEDYYRNELGTKENITILLKTTDKKVVGFALLEPYDSAAKEMREDDPELEKIDEPAFYLSIIDIHPDYRKKGGSYEMFDAIMNEMALRGAKRLVLHARVNNNFSNSLKKRFGEKIIKKRNIKKWKYYNYEEPCNYIEIQLD